MTTPAVIHFDGGTRPENPGPSAIGYIVETDDWTEEGSEHIGERDHTVYAGSEDGCVYAIDAETGETIWQYDTDAPISSGIGVGPHRVYALSNGRMYGLRRE